MRTQFYEFDHEQIREFLRLLFRRDRQAVAFLRRMFREWRADLRAHGTGVA